jgi:hypothetical protein
VQHSRGFVDLASQSKIGVTGIWISERVIMYECKGVSGMDDRWLQESLPQKKA